MNYIFVTHEMTYKVKQLEPHLMYLTICTIETTLAHVMNYYGFIKHTESAETNLCVVFIL